MDHKQKLLSKISLILIGAIDTQFKEAQKINWTQKKASSEPN